MPPINPRFLKAQRDVGIETALVSLFDRRGEVARIDFVFSNLEAGTGLATITGPLKDRVRELLTDETPIYTPQFGFVSGRTNLFSFIIIRLTDAIRNQEIAAIDLQTAGAHVPSAEKTSPYLVW